MPSVGSKTFENIHRGDVIIYELDSTIKPFVQACGLKADPALSNGTQERCYYLVLDKEYEPKRILKCVALIPPATLQGRPSPVLSGKKYFDGAAGKSCFIIVSNFVIINDVRDSTYEIALADFRISNNKIAEIGSSVVHFERYKKGESFVKSRNG